MAHEVSAGMVVYFRKEGHMEYLLLKHIQGHWAFPKGHVENEEELPETARRETREETGLDIEPNTKFRQDISYFFKNKEGVVVSKEVIYFLGQSKTQDVKISHEHADFAWLPYDEALVRVTFDNSKDVLKKAHEFLSQKTLDTF